MRAKRYIGYLRVSTDRQEYGLDAQEAAIRAAAEARGWAMMQEFAVDEGFSGRNAARPQLQAALEAITRNPNIDGLVVAKLDRLTRSVMDLGHLIELFEKHDKDLIALDLGLDTSTPAGRLVANVMCSVAQWEREVIAQRTKDAMAEAKAQGKTVSGPSVTSNDVIRELVLELRQEGLSMQQIADALNKRGVPTLRGGAEWRPSAIQCALK